MSDISKIDAGDIFLPEESRILNKTMKIREDMVDNFIKGGMPEKTGEIRVINEVLNAMDSQALGTTDRRLRFKEDETKNDMTEVIRDVLLNSRRIKEEAPVIETDVTVDIELKDEDIVLGEDIIEYRELDAKSLL